MNVRPEDVGAAGHADGESAGAEGLTDDDPAGLNRLDLAFVSTPTDGDAGQNRVGEGMPNR